MFSSCFSKPSSFIKSLHITSYLGPTPDNSDSNVGYGTYNDVGFNTDSNIGVYGAYKDVEYVDGKNSTDSCYSMLNTMLIHHINFTKIDTHFYTLWET